MRRATGSPTHAPVNVEHVAAFAADLDVLQEEILIGAPLARADHDRFVPLVDPVADEPD